MADAPQSRRANRSTTSTSPSRATHVVVHVALLVGAVVSLSPFAVMLTQSLMTLGETLTRTPWPATPQWSNYVQAWQDAEFGRYLRNSVIITSTTITGVLVTCTLAGYAFARIRFPGRDTLFALLLATLMIPGTVTFIPSFLLVRGDVIPWGSWLNTLPALTIPFISTAFIIFLFRQFFAQIPGELWDAARMDGAGHLRFLVTIVLPTSKPVLVTATLLTFVNAWNEFLWPLLVTTNPTWRPLAVGLANFVDEAGPRTHLLMAGSVITIVPVLLLYFFTQKQFTEGIATTGLKG
ncbi:MAG: carbohydrate ABC transporter permease [Chloroflexi bacterium]|nr:carbohydrate ABC transporter permease [Trueperaceae bacterium]MBA4169202.1 carbohydrate ABC transporter permease [Chloroflexota bacterium]